VRKVLKERNRIEKPGGFPFYYENGSPQIDVRVGEMQGQFLKGRKNLSTAYNFCKQNLYLWESSKVHEAERRVVTLLRHPPSKTAKRHGGAPK